MKENTNSKKKLIIGLAVILLIVIVIILLKSCGSTIKVSLDLNNGTDPIVIKLNEGEKININDYVNEDQLGEGFIGWYEEVGKTEDGTPIISNAPFNFDEEVPEDGDTILAVHTGDSVVFETAEKNNEEPKNDPAPQKDSEPTEATLVLTTERDDIWGTEETVNVVVSSNLSVSWSCETGTLVSQTETEVTYAIPEGTNVITATTKGGQTKTITIYYTINN